MKCPWRPLYSILQFALTVQLWKDAFGYHGCLDHIRPGEATVHGEHGEVVHKLLMETSSFIAELRPWEVTAEPLHTSVSLSQTQEPDHTHITYKKKSCIQRFTLVHFKYSVFIKIYINVRGKSTNFAVLPLWRCYNTNLQLAISECCTRIINAYCNNNINNICIIILNNLFNHP